MRDKVSAVIVDPNQEQRIMLKSAILAVNQYSKVFQARTPVDCLNILNNKDNDLLVVFISYEFDSAMIDTLLKQAKTTPAGVDSAYAVILKQEDQTTATISKILLKGIDGFLLYPYSVDALVEMTDLARSVKKQRRFERIEKTIRFLVQNLLKKLDLIARRKIDGAGPGEAIREFRQLGESARDIEVDMLVTYYQALLEEVEKMKPFPHRAPSSKGATSQSSSKTAESKMSAEDRLKQKMEQMGIKD